MSHPSSRSSRPSAMADSAGGEKLRRQSKFECPSPSGGTSTFSKCWWRLRNWLLDTTMSWRWFMSGNDREGNKNRATLAVARKMVAYMLAVERRKQDFVPTEEFGRHRGSVKTCLEIQDIRIIRCAGLPGPADDGLSDGATPEAPSVCFGTGREHKLNLLCGLFGVSDSKWMSGSAESRNHQPRGTVRNGRF
jgi:hypothetical protein